MTRKRYNKLVRAYLVTVVNNMDNVGCRKQFNKKAYRDGAFGYNGASYATSIDPLRGWLRANMKARV